MSGLRARPVPRTFTIEQLVGLAQEGALRTPQFQRQLKWGPEDITDLFDSIRRGYPIGNLLLSKGLVPASEVTFGPLRLSAPARPDGYLVVDGQQRIAALVGVLRHPDSMPRTGPYALYYDLEKEELLRPRGVPGPQLVPLNVVLSGTELHEWLDAHPLPSAELKRRLFDLGSRVREYVVPCYELPSSDESTLRHLFQRVNTAGKPMKTDEVFDAIHGENGSLTLRAVASRLAEQTSFGELDPKTIERACAAVGGRDERADHADLPRAFEGMRRTVDFLVQAGFCHRAVFPYALPLIVLPAFFDKHPSPSPRVVTLLSRWVWRGALTGAHGASSNANVRDLLGRIESDPERTVERFLETVRVPESVPDAMLAWTGNSAAMRAYLAAFLMTAPAQAGFLSALELPGAGSRALGEMFVDVSGDKHVSIARALLCPRPVAGTRQGPAKRVESMLAAPEWRAVNGVSDQAVSAYEQRDFSAFATLRARVLDERVVPYLRGQAAEDDGDRPSIVSLVAEAREAVVGYSHANA